MKITPMPANGIPGTNISTGNTASSGKMAAAKALAAGEAPAQYDYQPVESYREPAPDVKRLKMKTNYTTSRMEMPMDAPEAESAQSNIIDAAAEDTKPLDPQLAALARQRRALQVKERELADREKAFLAQNQNDSGDAMARLKSMRPTSVMQELGISYDQLTEDILASSSGAPDINKLKEETLKTLEERMNKTLQDRDAQTEQQVLKDFERQADSISKTEKEFKLVQITKSVPDVVDLIHRTYKATGEVLDVREAMALVNKELRSDWQRVSDALSEGEPPEGQMPLQPQHRMRTLTNRDSAAPPMSAKQRAMLAFHNQLYKK